jgi:hypothetical protein
LRLRQQESDKNDLGESMDLRDDFKTGELNDLDNLNDNSREQTFGGEDDSWDPS